MSKKGRNQIPDFSPKPKGLPVSGVLPPKGKKVAPPRAPTVKPPATSSKSGRRGG